MFAFEYVVYNQRNKFLREVIRAVVVGATRDGNGHVVRVVVCLYNEVGTCFRCAVRAVGAYRGVFGEVTFRSERAIYFVCAYLVEAFALLPGRVSRSVFACNPRPAGSVEQVLSAQYVCLKEQLRGFYAAVYVAFGCKVHHIVYVVLGKKAVGQFAVAYVSVYEYAPLAVYIVLYCTVVACIRQEVEHNYLDVFILILLVKKVFDEIGADKSGGACY